MKRRSAILKTFLLLFSIATNCYRLKNSSGGEQIGNDTDIRQIDTTGISWLEEGCVKNGQIQFMDHCQKCHG